MWFYYNQQSSQAKISIVTIYVCYCHGVPTNYFYLEHTKGNLTPIYKCEPVINHLIYEDDLLVFSKVSLENAKSIKKSCKI